MTKSHFVLFGASHLSALALTVATPLVLAAIVRLYPGPLLQKRICRAFAVLLIVSWIAWIVVFYVRGWIWRGNILPMNLCDWATIAAIVTLIRPHQKSYELAYFWALAGTLQGLVTPDISADFPDAQYFVFFVPHGALIAAVLYLTLAMKMRPVLASIRRVVLWTLFYAVCAAAVDYLLGTNYGFLRAKPDHLTLFAVLAPWPYYILELVPIGLASVLIYGAPFFIADWARRPLPMTTTAADPNASVTPS